MLHPVFSALGAAATALMVLAMPLLIAEGTPGQTVNQAVHASGIGLLAPFAPAGYAGSSSCAGCHPGESRDWRDSHHAKAMAVPTEATVRGDFSGAEISVAGSRGRFFREDGKFLVETEGADGKPAVFTVSHTFGWEPLQQYLVALPDGRLQALPWAWDTRPREQGGQRWFHVYGEEAIPLSDTRHWTKSLQNWNHMCAECHSTAFDKGYDLAKNSFRSTFSEISVGCESCHGAGAKHIVWANTGAAASDPRKGFAATRPKRAAPDWSINPATGSPSNGVARAPGDEVETCARCHSRRGQVAADWLPGRPLGATHLPAWPSAKTDAVAASALSDPEPMARVAALRGIASLPIERRWRLGAPSLSDPVLIVRMAAAELLADQPLTSLAAADRALLETAFAEYEAAHLVNADRAEERAALGLFRQRQGRLPEAEAEYRTALRLEPGAVIAAVNLADLYRIQGREREADELLRRAVTLAPDAAMVQHALGLSLIRRKRYADAINHLGRALALDPASPRFAYVYAVALQSTGKAAEGERVLREAASRNPADVDILSALLHMTLRAGKIDQAAPLAARLAALRPDNPEFGRLAAGLNPKP
ncbi:MAG: tetratricopeptide repeat protein [Methylocystis sp.]|nr:tetratricopeptide repeat protein [Methylocystis sp.]MCA3583030.1 tetratricopeptide repeat protein [Methylocystis sp.]MCA3588888.1 tetratricopeptide repeat protein [Methylocystis sp.]MCA3590435.1 tetratricopeptide repeat protein [Methylocystis sp.]